jgi:5-aminolevulinate synthase
MTEGILMDFDIHFKTALDTLKSEGNYRVFAEVERQCGSFPKVKHFAGPEVQEVTVWCSNDYLGMGHHPDVVDSMVQAV